MCKKGPSRLTRQGSVWTSWGECTRERRGLGDWQRLLRVCGDLPRPAPLPIGRDPAFRFASQFEHPSLAGARSPRMGRKGAETSRGGTERRAGRPERGRSLVRGRSGSSHRRDRHASNWERHAASGGSMAGCIRATSSCAWSGGPAGYVRCFPKWIVFTRATRGAFPRGPLRSIRIPVQHRNR
jgi:hypothetical protein